MARKDDGCWIVQYVVVDLSPSEMARPKGHWFNFYGSFLKWWYPKNTPKWSFLVGKPMGFVGETHHFRKALYKIYILEMAMCNCNLQLCIVSFQLLTSNGFKIPRRTRAPDQAVSHTIESNRKLAAPIQSLSLGEKTQTDTQIHKNSAHTSRHTVDGWNPVNQLIGGLW